MKIPTIIWDLDSTIADTTHRQGMIDQIKCDEPTLTWDDYSMACIDDTPVHGVCTLMRIMAAADHKNIILSGRSECARDLTVAWLNTYGVKYDDLYLRPDGDRRSNHVYKIDVIDTLIKTHAIKLIVDDWPNLVAPAAERHISVMIVNSPSNWANVLDYA